MRFNRAGLLLLIVLVFPLGAGAVAWGDDFDIAALQRDVRETIDRVRPAVVQINGRGSSFSGVIVSPDGHVLSAGHAVEPGTRYRISLPDGRRLRGVGKGSNPRADAALIMISDPPADLPHVPMGDSTSLVANQPCIGLSYPGGQLADQEPVVRFGRVVRNSRRRGMLQSSALMEPGDSGGPLFDLNGCVIGIHSRIGLSMARNYEVPIEVYRTFWNELNREQVFTQSGPPMPRLGVQLVEADGDDDDATKGLAVVAVIEGSLAAKAGIEGADRLL
jgi:serine protease Do